MVSKDMVLEALKAVSDPDGGDLASSGRVRSLVVTGDRVGLALAAADPQAIAPTREAAERAVRAVAGVDEVLVAVVEDDAPLPPADREGAAPSPSGTDRADAGTASSGLGATARRLLGRFGKRASDDATALRGAPADAQGERPAPEHKDLAPAPPRAAAAEPDPASSTPVGRGPNTPTPRSPGARPPTLSGIARILAVGSGKGGVGKSTVATNLAVALAASGQRVGLLDADVFGPSVPTLIGASDYRPSGGVLEPVERWGITAMSIGFLVDPAKAVVWRGPMVTGALMQLVRDTRWGDLDTLVIDLPPGTGDIHLSLAQQVALDGAVVVTTPQDLSLIDARKAIAMFATVRVPVLGIVENMATFVCPRCGAETAVFGHGGGEAEAAAQGVPFLGRLPLAPAIRSASDAGRPVAADPSTPEGAAYGALAAEVALVLSGASAKPFPEIVFE